MSTPLGNPPLYLAVTQVKFNPVLDMDPYLPAIQRWMRGHEFIGVDSQPAHEASNSQPNQRTTKFSTRDGRSAFVLASNFLALRTTAYTEFSDFSAQFMSALGVVADEVEIALTRRVGIRYVNAIPHSERSPLDSLLADCVVGFWREAVENGGRVFSESIIPRDGYISALRVLVHSGKLAVPSDLLEAVKFVDDRFSTIDGVHALVDIDSYLEKDEDFSVSAVSSTLASLHGLAGDRFKQVTTAEALRIWS